MSKQKYTIADVQQKKLMEYGLDIKDAFILTYLKEISLLNNVVDKFISNKRYVWVDYKKLISYLPVLKISSEEVIGRRMSQYEKLGLIKRHLHRSVSYGTYTFFCLEAKFNSLFEIEKAEYEKNEIEEIKKKMGLKNPHSTFQSGGFDSKVESQSTQKSAHNTPKQDTPIQESSSREKEKSAAASVGNFEKDLKELLNQEKIIYNKNTVTNISKNSEKNLETVKEAVSYMKKSTKEMTPGVLVAILRDKDYTNTEKPLKGPQNRNEKVEFMKKYLDESEIQKLKELINKNLGAMPGAELYLDQELGNVLCQRYNKLPENEKFRYLGH